MIINNPDVMLAQSPLSSLDLRSQSRFHVLYPLSSMFLSADIPCLDACIRAHGLSREGITSIGITHPLLCQLLFARTWTKNCWNHATLPLLHIRKNNQENSATLFLIIYFGRLGERWLAETGVQGVLYWMGGERQDTAFMECKHYALLL